MTALIAPTVHTQEEGAFRVHSWGTDCPRRLPEGLGHNCQGLCRRRVSRCVCAWCGEPVPTVAA